MIKNKKVCKECGETTIRYAKGLCLRCYNRKRYHELKGTDKYIKKRVNWRNKKYKGIDWLEYYRISEKIYRMKKKSIPLLFELDELEKKSIHKNKRNKPIRIKKIRQTIFAIYDRLYVYREVRNNLGKKNGE